MQDPCGALSLHLEGYVKYKALYTQACRLCAAPFACGARLINFSRTWGKQRTLRCMERTTSASSSLCVRAKNQQISVHRDWCANHSRTEQHRFAVPSTHTRIWFVNHSQVICEPFGALVYTRLKIIGQSYWFTFLEASGKIHSKENNYLFIMNRSIVSKIRNYDEVTKKERLN